MDIWNEPITYKQRAAYLGSGFSTYGEQIGPLHVNQTMTGVAFYRSEQES